MPKQYSPVISSVSVSPASGPGGTVFSASLIIDGAPLAITYQWRLDGRDIAGANTAQHVAGPAGQLTVHVAVSGPDGSDVRESAPVTVVPGAVLPEVTEARVVPEGGEIGARFTAVAAAAGVPVPELGFQWLLDGVTVQGATGPSFTATAAGSLSVVVTARNMEGAGSLESEPVTVGGAQTEPVLQGVTIEPGSGNLGDTFFATASADGNPVPGIVYQWLIDGQPIPGATAASFVPQATGALSVRATATNTVGSDTAQSTAVQVGVALVPPAIGSIAILPDNGRVGDLFTASVSTSGHPEPVLTYQWLLDGQPIAGATAASHVAVASGALSVRATATNGSGSDIGNSGAVMVAAALVPPAIQSLTIAPAAGHVGDVFVATAVATGSPAPVVSYQWSIAGSAIPGAVSASHVATGAGTLSVRATATSLAGAAYREASVSVSAIGAPVAASGPHDWIESIGTGIRSFDAAARFSVPGDPAKGSVTYRLVSGLGGGPFLEGVLEEGVFVPAQGGYVTLDALSGLLSVDTNASGPLDGAALVVRGANSAGYDDLDVSLRVGAAVSGAAISEVRIAGSGQCWTEHRVSFRLGGALIERSADLPEGTSVVLQWHRAGAAIAGAQGWTYEPVSADDATALSVRVRILGAAGQSEATSAPLAVTNPDILAGAGAFASPEGWTLGSGATIEGGQLVKTNGVAVACWLPFTARLGETYRFTFDIQHRTSGAATPYLASTTAAQYGTPQNRVGSFSEDVTATADRVRVGLRVSAAEGQLLRVDNLVVKRIA